MSRIGIFGGGYVGLVTGAGFAALGHDVTIRDVVPQRVDDLRAGEIPIYEPGLDDLFEANRERLHFTTSPAEAVEGAEALFVCVGTPATYSGDADLSAVWTVLDDLAGIASDTVLVMKSACARRSTPGAWGGSGTSPIRNSSPRGRRSPTS
jgi:UDPglucose 6-dehydrogenase